MTNTERTLTDRELMGICGGNRDEWKQEINDRCFCYNIGDEVEVYVWFDCTRRARIIDRRWDNFNGYPEYRIQYLEKKPWYIISLDDGDWCDSRCFE